MLSVKLSPGTGGPFADMYQRRIRINAEDHCSSVFVRGWTVCAAEITVARKHYVNDIIAIEIDF